MPAAAPPERPQVIDWAVAGVSLEQESGDLHVVRATDRGALLAVIDGLGHGPEAGAAARAAAAVLEAARAEPIGALVERCHEALQQTRGAVMTLALVDAHADILTWVGIGNVEAVLVRGGPGRDHETPALRGGIVGYQLPPLRPETVPLARGDVLVMATDGIRSEFLAGLTAAGSPDAMANTLLSRYARRTDDALVLVARYLGATP